MPNGSGVTTDELPDGRWRVRWRETVVQDGVERRVQRQRNVSTMAAAQELAAKVLRAVEAERPFEPEVRVVSATTSIDQLLPLYFAFLRSRGLADGTIANERTAFARLTLAMRKAWSVPDGKTIPAARLDREGFAEVANALRELPKARRKDGTERAPRSARTHYADLTRLAVFWQWASDSPTKFPGVPPAPRVTAGLLPRQPVRVAPEAPTLAEVDAMIREVVAMGGRAAHVALPVAVVGRGTGLRAAQILALEPADVNLEARTLVVRTGKSDAEKALHRTVPIPADLAVYLTPFFARAAERGQERLFGHKRGTAVQHPNETLRKAWEAATAKGLARREVWAPSGRTAARPEHALRAAFQAALVEAGVREETIDALVGHVTTTRARAYVSPSSRWEAMRAAVDALSPVDWTGPGEALPENVVRMR